MLFGESTAPFRWKHNLVEAQFVLPREARLCFLQKYMLCFSLLGAEAHVVFFCGRRFFAKTKEKTSEKQRAEKTNENRKRAQKQKKMHAPMGCAST